jgi:hypothetical protein
MIRLADVPKAAVEMLCFHEAFRRLGFPSEKIFAAVWKRNDGKIDVGVELRAPDNRGRQANFTIGCGTVELDHVAFGNLWSKLVHAYNHLEISEADVSNAWKGSMALDLGAHLIAGLLDKGIAVPAGQFAIARLQQGTRIPARPADRVRPSNYAAIGGKD